MYQAKTIKIRISALSITLNLLKISENNARSMFKAFYLDFEAKKVYFIETSS